MGPHGPHGPLGPLGPKERGGAGCRALGMGPMQGPGNTWDPGPRTVAQGPEHQGPGSRRRQEGGPVPMEHGRPGTRAPGQEAQAQAQVARPRDPGPGNQPQGPSPKDPGPGTRGPGPRPWELGGDAALGRCPEKGRSGQAPTMSQTSDHVTDIRHTSQTPDHVTDIQHVRQARDTRHRRPTC